LSAAVWCEEHRGGVYPDRLTSQSRALARQTSHSIESDACVIDIGVRTNDSTLLGIMRDRLPKMSDEKWQAIVENARKVAHEAISASRRPILDYLWEVAPGPLPTTVTVRRAAPRIGRNEPCHCGSGKKYKHCCYDKDRERLQNSSDVAGLTKQELSTHPEAYM